MKEQNPQALSRLAGTPAYSCPRCRSHVVHRSHRRGMFDYVLHALGAEVRRCHDCRSRHAAFTTFTLPLGEPTPTARRWTRLLVMASGLLGCLLFAWWAIRRFTDLSG